MSELTQRITGMSDAELREYDFPSFSSYSSVLEPSSLESWARLPARMRMGLIITPKELDKEREQLRLAREAIMARFKKPERSGQSPQELRKLALQIILFGHPKAEFG